MMRFPRWLTADLALTRIARKLHLGPRACPIQFVDATEILHHDSSHPVSHEKIREINYCPRSVVWIGGSEPLRHPGIPHLVRAVTQTGHFVFLETDGTLLRRRIHEFQPVSRLFLTVRLEPGTQGLALERLRPGAFQLATEGVRTARLCGFLTCVHALVHAETELGEIAELVQYAHERDVDGIVITPASGGSNSTNPDAAALHQKSAEARKLIRSMWWEFFSRIVESAMTNQRRAARNAGESGVRAERESQADEEGVRIA